MAEDIEVDVDVKTSTDMAILVSDGDREVWIPKSKISDYMGDTLETAESIFIPEWLAQDKGLI